MKKAVTEVRINGFRVVVGQEIHAEGHRLGGRLTITGFTFNSDGSLKYLDVETATRQARVVKPEQVTQVHRKINPRI